MFSVFQLQQISETLIQEGLQARPTDSMRRRR